MYANGPVDRGSIPGRVIPKTQKWYLMPSCLTLSVIRHGSRISEAIQQIRLGVEVNEKEALESLSITVAKFTFALRMYNNSYTGRHWLHPLQKIIPLHTKKKKMGCPGNEVKQYPVVRLQIWISGLCKVPFYYHYFQVHSEPERYYLPTPPLGQDMTQGQFLSGV